MHSEASEYDLVEIGIAALVGALVVEAEKVPQRLLAQVQRRKWQRVRGLIRIQVGDRMGVGPIRLLEGSGEPVFSMIL